jgi:sigma-B regulation protein RsbU (phosphoserine phosphatase)
MDNEATGGEGPLRRIESITDATHGRMGLDDPVEAVLDELRALLEADTAAVLEFDPVAEQLVAVAARGVEEEVRQGVRVPLGEGFAGRIVTDNRPHMLDHVDGTTVVNPILWKRGIRRLVGVPMHAAGRITGVLHIGRLVDRSFTDHDVEVLQHVADRLAFHNHLRGLEVHRAAATALQRSLLPSRLPRLDGLDVAARYVPEDAGVGGDWYDVFRLPSGWLGIVVGDVAGHGLPAAIVMGRIRSALRAYALESEDPAVVLQKLDREVQHFEPDTTATVLYAVVEPSTERVHLSTAGHPAPMLAVPGATTRMLDIPADPLLGVGMVPPRRTSVVDLPEGALVFFYTDGLVERREGGLEERLRRLCRSVVAGAPESVCATVMGDLVGDETPDDDITVVAVRRCPDGVTRDPRRAAPRRRAS